MTQRSFTAIVAATIASLLHGCAMVDDKAMALLASSADAIVLINGRVLGGQLKVGIDHTGSLSVSQTAAVVPDKAVPTVGNPLSCAGQFRYTSTTAGQLDLRCSDGAVVALAVTMLAETRGYGFGQSPMGTVSLTFGMSPQEARAYLMVPPGKQLKPLPKAPFFEMQ